MKWVYKGRKFGSKEEYDKYIDILRGNPEEIEDTYDPYAQHNEEFARVYDEAMKEGTLALVWEVAPKILTPKQLEIMVMSYKKGFSLRKIASQLGVSFIAVFKTRRLAEQKLKKYFETHG